ncbi:MAG: hypothetical protein K0B37_09830 [Bacteroidales bacterium]|nr:hypothetical protein [Bacteroidales bacterium]
MNKNHPKYLAFKKKDRIRFQEKFTELSSRAKGILINFDMQTWDAFYYHFLINHDVGEFDVLRNVGNKTKEELLTFARSMLNPDGQYTRELEKFEFAKSSLSSLARSALRHTGISLFETFYYRLVIEKEVIDFKHGPRCGEKTLPEVVEFVEYFCSYLGVKRPRKENVIYFNPDNPKIPFIADLKLKKAFLSEFVNLSKNTKANLTNIGADNMDGFYTAFISPKSPFNVILKEFGESTLMELLRFRSTMKDHIKSKKTSAR